MPFGLTVAGDMFQRKMDVICNPLSNVIGIADDIIIWGDKEDGSDHDEALTTFLAAAKENGLKVNYKKVQYKTKEISFFGETFTTEGHKPDTAKVKAIREMETPTNVKELQTFLGMCQFLAKHSPWIAELAEPLRQLTCKDTLYIWGPEHDEAL